MRWLDKTYGAFQCLCGWSAPEWYTNNKSVIRSGIGRYPAPSIFYAQTSNSNWATRRQIERAPWYIIIERLFFRWKPPLILIHPNCKWYWTGNRNLSITKTPNAAMIMNEIIGIRTHSNFIFRLILYRNIEYTMNANRMISAERMICSNASLFQCRKSDSSFSSESSPKTIYNTSRSKAPRIANG